MDEFEDSLDEFRTLETRNTVSNDIYLNGNNDVFDDISQLVGSTSNVNEGTSVGFPMEWTSSCPFGDTRSIAERRAVFNDSGCPMINVEQFRSVSPFSSSSPLITIPAGISPTELLNSQAQPSSFQLSPLNRESVTLDSSIRSQLLETHISFPSVSNKGFEEAVEFPSFITNSDTELSADFEYYSEDKMDHLALTSYPDGDTLSASRTLEDGYNWRKYGQKQVKGSEFPRSYYRCSYTNCPATKKVERTLDGDVSEIIYNNSHNHPPRQPNPRSSSDNGEPIQVWRNIQPNNDPTENTGAFPMAQMKSSGFYEVGNSSEPPIKLVCRDEHSAYLDESELKRRKIDSPIPNTNVASSLRGAREPRVVVKLKSEVDILDDGYKWRKYGQKVVKGNKNPRSYYKCTSTDCRVRKHVERASDDIEYVITAYEGKHNHEIPIARTATIASTSSSQPNTRPTYTNVSKTEAHMGNIPGFGNDLMRSALLGTYGSNMYPLHYSHSNNVNLMGYNYNVGMSNFPMPPLLYDVPPPPSITMPTSLSAPMQSSGDGQQQPTRNNKNHKGDDLAIIKQ